MRPSPSPEAIAIAAEIRTLVKKAEYGVGPDKEGRYQFFFESESKAKDFCSNIANFYQIYGYDAQRRRNKYKIKEPYPIDEKKLFGVTLDHSQMGELTRETRKIIEQNPQRPAAGTLPAVSTATPVARQPGQEFPPVADKRQAASAALQSPQPSGVTAAAGRKSLTPMVDRKQAAPALQSPQSFGTTATAGGALLRPATAARRAAPARAAQNNFNEAQVQDLHLEGLPRKATPDNGRIYFVFKSPEAAKAFCEALGDCEIFANGKEKEKKIKEPYSTAGGPKKEVTLDNAQMAKLMSYISVEGLDAFKDIFNSHQAPAARLVVPMPDRRAQLGVMPAAAVAEAQAQFRKVAKAPAVEKRKGYCSVGAEEKLMAGKLEV